MSMIARIRELSTPPRDDHDRAVLLLCDQYEALLQQGEPEGISELREHVLNAETPIATMSGGIHRLDLTIKEFKALQCLLSASPLPPAPGAETGE